MSEDEQEVYRKVHRENCLIYEPKGEWSKTHITSFHSNYFDNSSTYAIKPDYQPEPEYMDLEIELKGGHLGCWITQTEWQPIHTFVSLSNFEGFYLRGSDNVEVRPEWVARYYPKVYVRLGK